ncbi:MAG: hypothetical protein AAF236_12770 [Verrucomicrobiota bacterium]
MKPSKILVGLSALALATPPLFSQIYTPPQQPGGGGGSSQPQQNTTVVQQSGGNQSSGNQRVLGNDAPYLDPTTNVFSFDGKSFNVADNAVFRARFEKFLNSAEATSQQDLAYRKVMREILDALSPHNREPEKFQRAVAMLQLAASFPQDARLSESLSNAVYRVYLSSRNQAQLQQLNAELDRQRRRLDWNYDQWKDAGRRERKLSDDPNESENEALDPTNAGHIQRYVQRIAEVEANRVANAAKIELTEVEAKLEFQALIVQFFAQRRFEHVIMAARYYTEFFQDGAGRLEFQEGSEVEQTFGKMIGFNPTITTLDSFANEAIRDVGQQVESFGYLLTRGEIDGATRQLQQAFMTGEYLPSVQAIPREKKRQVLDYARDSFQLVNALEVKDYTLAEELVLRMKDAASDFDYSKPMAAIQTARLSSNMRIRTAKNAALQGDQEGYAANIQAAAEIWPMNPQLTEQFDIISDNADVALQAKLEFDRLLGTQSYRQIFNSRARFIAATIDDPERQAALEQVVTNITEIEGTMKQADALLKAGSPHAAWEITEEIFQKFPDDVALSAKRADLSTEVADFVKALKTAENLEERRQHGSSLAWFLTARRIFPQSDFAADGISRLVEQILPEDLALDETADLGSSFDSNEL